MTARPPQTSPRATLLLSLTGLLLGVVALTVIAYLVYGHYTNGIGDWEREKLYWLIGAMLMLLVAMRLRARAAKRRSVEAVRAAPEQPKGELNQRLRIYEQRAETTAEKNSGGDAAAGDDFEVKLRKLHDLKTAGILSEAEFEAKKSEILRKID